MQNISFFTPVKYSDCPQSYEQSLVEGADDYFFIGGSKAHVTGTSADLRAEKAVLSEEKSSFILTALKILSYCTIIIPLVMLTIKSILRSCHNYEKIDAQQELEKGVVVTEASKNKIADILPEILQARDHKDIIWLSRGNNLVFQLAGDGNHVYKIARPCHFHRNYAPPTGGSEQTKARYANMVKAKEVSLANKLSHLVIPQSSLLTFNFNDYEYSFIVEEKIEIDGDEKDQKNKHIQHESELTETVRELAIFVAKTGFNDVTWRNIPIIKEKEGFNGSRRVALIDLEHMQSPTNGFIGDANSSCGLIGCVSYSHFDMVVEEMKKQGVYVEPGKIEQLKKDRLLETKNFEELAQFYEDNEITNPRTPISIDLEDLGLDLDQEGEIEEYVDTLDQSSGWQKRSISLRDVAKEVIDELNTLIQNSPERESIQSQRLLDFNTGEAPFSRYSHLGLPKGQLLAWSDKDRAKLWINQILHALVEKEALFQVKENLYGFSIQA